jgi:hypothetical protein
MKRFCLSCGHPNEYALGAEPNFCGGCGKSLVAGQAKASIPDARPKLKKRLIEVEEEEVEEVSLDEIPPFEIDETALGSHSIRMPWEEFVNGGGVGVTPDREQSRKKIPKKQIKTEAENFLKNIATRNPIQFDIQD